jgi:hypothetical protein
MSSLAFWFCTRKMRSNVPSRVGLKTTLKIPARKGLGERKLSSRPSGERRMPVTEPSFRAEKSGRYVKCACEGASRPAISGSVSANSS